MLLLDSRREAVVFPTALIELAFCHSCGFIWNAAFKPTLHDYGDRYEPTQRYSPTFNRFHQTLVDDLINRFDLHDKRVVEIGCGQGEFLQLLCERGNNTGIGFDPAYLPIGESSSATQSLTFITDFYSEKYAHIKGDFFACKMTLEHIADVSAFVANIRNVIGDQSDALIFFQVPAIERILAEAAFWDIYYEHCSYFSLGSLARLFRRERFEVLDLWTAYDAQYLMLAARPSQQPTMSQLPQEDDLAVIRAAVTTAAQQIAQTTKRWRQRIQNHAMNGECIVLWGGGSKGVSFLTTLDISDEIRYVVDINPRKANTFIAGSGQEIVGPDALVGIRPNRVIIMNPIYRDEITTTLHNLNLYPTIETIVDPI